MVSEPLLKQMVKITLVNGKKTSKLDMERKSGLMVVNTRDILKIQKSKALARMFGARKNFLTQEIGLKTIDMDLESTIC